mmetsp:Transcript_19645/g.45917  ORF Transcript_19645/g.45917 Transcript_19645/m.45917 type:complete len:181 (+) Transcript_19645:18-560(+)
MNTNNFISERSSTRLHAPPGGTSQAGSLIFGGAAAGPAEAISSNKYASGSNQNCGNVMTGRSSTRLHAPPGGTSQAGSLIFGGANAGDRFAGHRGNRSQQTSSISFGNNNTTAAAQEPFKAKAVNNQVQQQQTVTKKIGGGTSANAFASGTNQNCGNFITDRPTSRVLAPPGGKSSGPLW